MKAVLFGPPGSGKGTYAQYFKGKYCIPHLSIGDILREEVAKNSEIGRIARKYIEKGELVPDDIVIEIVINKLKNIDLKQGFILDGYPRTLNQAKALDNFLKIDVAIYIYAPLNIAIERLSYRYICPVCGRIYNLKYVPPKNDLKCDLDNSDLIRRADDNHNVIKYRYELYLKESKPIIEYYRARKLLIEIDNSGSSYENIKLLEKILVEKSILKTKPCREDL
ncbi:MAG: nucleoside monophosphate kinase [Desulfurococcaceae archaeon]